MNLTWIRKSCDMECYFTNVADGGSEDFIGRIDSPQTKKFKELNNTNCNDI